VSHAPGPIVVAWIGGGSAPPLLDDVRRHLARTFAVEARLGELAGRPTAAFDARRGQLESTRILRWLRERVPAGARTLLAVTDDDLCVTVLTYVFGEAQVGGPTAVVSTARLGQGLDDAPASPLLVRRRLLKEAVHEVGHSFGLTHCRARDCVMSRSNTIHDVDRKGDEPCRVCRAALEQRPHKEAP
jgi:archaemetzincin